MDEWWAEDPDEYGCTVEQLEEVLEHSLSLVNLPFAKYLNKTNTTETGDGLVSEYNVFWRMGRGAFLLKDVALEVHILLTLGTHAQRGLL